MVDNMKIEDEQSHEDSHSKTLTNVIQVFQERFHLQQSPSGPHHHQQQQQQMHQQNNTDAFFPIFPEVSPILPPWTLPHHQVHSFNPVHYPLTNPIRDHHHHDPFLHLPPPPSSYGGLFNTGRRPNINNGGLQFAYDGQVVQTSSSLAAAPFGLQAELQKMTAQEIMDAKALAASKSHSEAERRRRERINNHLAKLRSLLPSTTKTDKASLLAEVIQHVKELKRQTSMIAETTQIPTEIDELTVDNAADEDGKFIIRASLCCEDRSDLLPDLIKTLKSLRLRTLKAEITTLGGRVKNVLFITSEDDTNSNTDDQDEQQQQPQRQQNFSLSSIHEALKAVMEKSNGDESGSGNVKRQRTNNNINIHEHRSL